MNFPETCPDLWPQYQRRVLEQRRSPYLKLNFAVSEPGKNPEDPSLPFKSIIERSDNIRRNIVELSLNDLSTKTGGNDAKKDSGSPSPPALSKTNRRTGYGVRGKRRPQHIRRYKNANGVYVYYQEKEKRTKYKSKPSDKKQMAHNEMQELATQQQVDYILDYIIEAIKKKRSVFGHKITNTFDAFAAFDKVGNGRLGADDFVNAMKRLGSILPSKVLKGFVYKLDGEGRNGFIEYGEFRDAINKRIKFKR